MKLYASVTSERATKGQGGNYLIISIKNSLQENVCNISVEDGGDNVVIINASHNSRAIVRRTPWDGYNHPPLIIPSGYKGKKQKGECQHGNAEASCATCGFIKAHK